MAFREDERADSSQSLTKVFVESQKMCIYSRLLISQNEINITPIDVSNPTSALSICEATIINQSTTQDIMQEGGKIVGCVISVLLWARSTI